MTLVHYEPWNFGRWQRRIDRILNDAFGAEVAGTGNVAWIPSVDVSETADRYVVRADLPGVDPKNIEITAEDGVLTLRGERQAEKRDETQNGSLQRYERVAGSFLRRFTLPETAQADAITATYTNGVLELSIPKQAKPEPRRIKVEAA